MEMLNAATMDVLKPLAKREEGLGLTAYRCIAGKITIGYGHTGPDVRPGMTIDLAEAERLLVSDLAWVDRTMIKTIKVGVSPKQRAALASLILNIGAGAWKSSTALRRLNAGDYEGCAEAMTWWNKITTKEGSKIRSNSLANRRERERRLFLEGITDRGSEGPIDAEDGTISGGEQKPATKSKTIGGAVTGAAGGAAAIIPAVAQADWKVAIPLIIVLGALAFIVLNRVIESRKGEH